MTELHKLTAIEIQSRYHRLVLSHRGQDRIVQSDVFIEAWNRADVEDRKYVLTLFAKPNTYELKRWILKIMVGGLNQYPVKILRQIASYHLVKNYSRMSKPQILESLTEKGVIDGSKDS